jgi:predicted RNA-binding Zn ribbon-like protein
MSLSTLHARFVAEAELAPGDFACRWRWRVDATPVEAALGPIALAAVRLFTQGDFSRIRECGGHACGWLFYDTSKNNRRRWCEMEVCGNRAKQRRLRARREKAEAGREG